MERKRQFIVATAIVLIGSAHAAWCAEPTASSPVGQGQRMLSVAGPQGQVVHGAKIGTGINIFENSQGHPPQRIVMWLRGQRRQWPFQSDLRGNVLLTGEEASYQQFYVLYEPRGWVGYYAPEETSQSGDIAIRLQPACHVHGRLTSREFGQLGHSLLETATFVYDSGGRMMMYFVSERAQYEFLLPSGEYRIEVEGKGPNGARTQRLGKPLVIEAGDSEKDLAVIDLPATKLASLFGKVAPELQGITVWVNSDPASLASLRGRPVVLTFWGHWCVPCVQTMPALIELREEFQRSGVVFITVHDNTVKTADELKAKLAELSARSWQNKELPFCVALDSGDGSGDVHTAYGITQWPTTLLIGRDGKLVGEFTPWGDLRSELRRMLGLTGP
jgi:thiol-disulfide isomerase/thioredoxin